LTTIFDWYAPVADVIGIRQELDHPLVRFRAAMIEYSDSVKSATWDDDFPLDAERIFREKVEPTVAAIEEAVHDNHFVRQFMAKLPDKQGMAAQTSVLGSVLAPLTALPQLVVLGIHGAVAVSLSTVGLGAYYEWAKQQRLIEQNNLYFYFRAGKQLERSTF
jgi:hypothetical protein